jgi:hypothetical protein
MGTIRLISLRLGENGKNKQSGVGPPGAIEIAEGPVRSEDLLPAVSAGEKISDRLTVCRSGLNSFETSFL